MPDHGLVGSYVELGLRLGRHIDGLVDAYYGPEDLARRVAAEPLASPERLAANARELLAGIDAGEPLDDPELAPVPATKLAAIAGAPAGAATPGAGAPAGTAHRGAPAIGRAPIASAPRRRRWLRAQAVGLLTTAQVLAGRSVGYADEVEACYGVRPQRVPEEAFAEAHARLQAVVPGSGPLAERFMDWREAQAVPPERLVAAVNSLSEDLRERTRAAFGLPEGEHVDFELVRHRPWSGFNYYLGGLRSRVAVNVDLPVLSTGLAHLVAHEAYPGHHTEHCRKEVGLVRRAGQAEEMIFLVGTPQCLMAEGLADLGLEIVVGRRPEAMVAAHLRPLGIRYDPEVVATVADAAETLGAARANAAFRLHQDGADPEVVVGELARWALLPRARAAKAVEFLMDPTWRAYVTCYVEGLAICRRWVGGSLERFGRLITEQMIPADLATSG